MYPSWMESVPPSSPAIRAHLGSEVRYHQRILSETGVTAAAERLLEEMSQRQHEADLHQVRDKGGESTRRTCIR